MRRKLSAATHTGSPRLRFRGNALLFPYAGTPYLYGLDLEAGSLEKQLRGRACVCCAEERVDGEKTEAKSRGEEPRGPEAPQGPRQELMARTPEMFPPPASSSLC